MKPRTFATVFGTKLQLSQTGLISSLLLWMLLALLSRWLWSSPLGTAILWGFVATFVHWVSTFSHHLGHAAAAKHTGYPMVLIRMFYLLCGERYPRDEPELSPKIHLRRAGGGPILSFIYFAAGALTLWVLPSLQPFLYGLLLFFTLENLLIYFIGSLIPLGFTDGSTILYWRRRQKLES